MIGRRASDVASPGFRSFLVIVAILAVYVAIITYLPVPEIKAAKPVDACRDGVVQSFDGENWHPVTIDRKSHYYDGKKWAPDYPAGHVRTIPCGESK